MPAGTPIEGHRIGVVLGEAGATAEPDAEPDAEADAQGDEDAVPGQEQPADVSDLGVDADLDCQEQ